MSQQNGILDITFKAGADLSAKQYFIVKVSADQTVNLSSAVTDVSIGVLQNKPKSGEAAVVRILGTTKVSTGTPVGLAYGVQVVPDANGQAKAAGTDKDQVIGIALGAASAAVGDVKEMLLVHYKASI